jgi:putative ABC transport system permease protein
MDWTAYVRDGLTLHHPTPDDDVVEEMAQHAATTFEVARMEGLTGEDAAARVRALVDGWCQDPSTYRRRPRRAPVVVPPPAASRGWTGFGQDLRYGARLLRRQPGFALMATLLIALGVGAATTLSSLTYAVLLKPLPWPEADRLVGLVETREGATRSLPNLFTNASYLAWRDAPATLESVAGYSTSMVTVTGSGAPERLRVLSATASLFTVLRARPLHGTLFTDADEVQGRDHVMVLTYGLWQRGMGGRSDAVGTTLDLDGDAYRIVGVMPQEFAFPGVDVQACTPMRVPPVLSTDPKAHSISLFRAIGRLKPNVTVDQASAEGTARGRAAPDLGMVGTAVFGTQGKPRVAAVPYLAALTADVRPALLVLLAAVVLLFVVAVANVAGMQLARSTTRRREVAIRSALGAGPGRLARQLLTENLLIGLAGGVAGWGLSLALHHLLPRLLAADFPRVSGVLADWRVLVLAIGSSLCASVAFGVLPARLASRLNLVEALVEDSLAPAGGGVRSRVGRMRTAIMTGQIAIAAVLLVGASLLGRSFFALLSVDRGYEPRNLLTAIVPMPDRQFTGQRRAAALDAIVDRLAHTPGVAAAAGASIMPLVSYDQMMGFTMKSARPGSPDVAVQANMRTVSEGYFAALGMHVAQGRGFSSADTVASLPVVIVNRAFVRKYLVDPPLGFRLPINLSQTVSTPQGWEIVGIVDDVRQRGATDPPQPEVFLTYHQLAEGMRMSVPVLVVRTTGDPAALVPALRSVVHEENASLVLDSVMTMDERLLASLARPRLYALLLGTFAVFALLVAGTGLFVVLSYNVAQRTREIGVRAALGATPAHLVGLVLRQGVTITIAGAVAGLAAAALLVKYVGTLLYGVTTTDPWTFGLVPVVLVAAAAAACYAPARRAARIDPLKALKQA